MIVSKCPSQLWVQILPQKSYPTCCLRRYGWIHRAWVKIGLGPSQRKRSMAKQIPLLRRGYISPSYWQITYTHMKNHLLKIEIHDHRLCECWLHHYLLWWHGFVHRCTVCGMTCRSQPYWRVLSGQWAKGRLATECETGWGLWWSDKFCINPVDYS